MPELSVIVPVYNVEGYIYDCIDSILNQTFSDIEIVCVDDGSTDKSGMILDNYTSMDNRIKVIHTENNGLVSARKTGISFSTGRYITYVDSDDWIDSNMYSEMMSLAIANDADVVTSGYIREYESETQERNEYIPKGVYRGNDLKEIYYKRFIGTDLFFEFNVPGSLCNKIMKRERVLEYQSNIPNGVTMGEDAAVTYPLLLHSNTIVVTGKNYYHYRIRSNSITSQIKDDNEFLFLESLFMYIEKACYDKLQDLPLLSVQLKLWETYIILCKWPERVITVKNGMLFPFRNVREGERIVLYGMGRFGFFLNKYLRSIGFDIVAILDSHNKNGLDELSRINDYDFDKVIIAVLRADDVMEIKNELFNRGVPREKIQQIECSLLKYN